VRVKKGPDPLLPVPARTTGKGRLMEVKPIDVPDPPKEALEALERMVEGMMAACGMPVQVIIEPRERKATTDGNQTVSKQK